MTKRLIDAAQAVVEDPDFRDSCATVDELQAALDEARQPVTVTPDQAVEILAVMLSTFGEPVTQEARNALSAEDKQETAMVVTAILQKARELGL